MSEKNICVLGQVVAVWRAEAGTLPSLELYKLNGSGLVVIGEGHLADLRDFLNAQVPGEKVRGTESIEVDGNIYKVSHVRQALMESAAWRKAVERAKKINAEHTDTEALDRACRMLQFDIAEGKP